MCPYSREARSGPKNVMSETLFKEIICQHSRMDSLRGVLIMLQNEPTLDPDFIDRIRIAKAMLGKSVEVFTVTNGSLLNRDYATALQDAGLDRIIVSIDAATKETYSRVRPGTSFEEVRKNTEDLIRIFPKGRVAVNFLRQRDNQGEMKAFVRYWSDRGAQVRFGNLTNRAGQLDAFKNLLPSSQRNALQKAIAPFFRRLIPCCPLPFETGCVLWDGRVTLCCHDWRPTEVMGDLSHEEALNVWNSERVNHHRRLLLSGRAEESTICRNCSLARHFRGYLT